MVARSFAPLLLASLLFGCDQGADDSPSSEGTAPGAAATLKDATGGDGGGSLADSVRGAVDDAKADADEAMEDLSDDAKATAAAAREDLAKTQGAALSGLSDLGAAVDSGFGVDKLEESIGSLSPDRLKELADKILSSVKEKQGLVEGLRAQLDKLGVTEIAKVKELKEKVQSALGDLSGLKEKLKIVVDKLEESGIDVSKYTAMLSGS